MNNTILIADSGSTKTDWCLSFNNKPSVFVSTKGINPFYQSQEEILADLQTSLIPSLQKESGNNLPSIDGIYFYGAGCTPEKSPIVHDALAETFQDTGTIEVASDMLGAARSVCQHNAGIVCILGTGSNSCYFDGIQITANVSPLGFILGDEGSGANLGKLMVGNLLKNQMTPGLKEKFLEEYKLTPAEIIDRVYRHPFPNRFLASLNKFLEDNITDESVHKLVLGAFDAFIRRNVMQYEYEGTPVHFIGSIAIYYHKVLEEAALATGLIVGNIVEAPLDGLVKYHQDL
ncbi:MAG: ATPase [Bacteroidota bacterium]|nr:ATPase [Bacteroidota bacterium]